VYTMSIVRKWEGCGATHTAPMHDDSRTSSMQKSTAIAPLYVCLAACSKPVSQSHVA
jgi:hypothetical protein